MLPHGCASGKHASLCYTGRRPAAQYFAAGGRINGLMSDHKRKLALAAVIVASATAVSRLTGLGREVITAAIYGVDPSYNTFVSVSVIPQLVQQLFADAAISAAFVPVFTSLLAKGELERAYRLAANLLGLIVVVVGAAVAILALAAGPLTQLVYPELTTTVADAELAAQLLRILVPTILFLSLAGAVSGVLYSFERFTMPAVVSIVWNLTIIAAIALFHESLGVSAIAWGMLLGTALEVMLLAGAARYHGRWLWPRFGLGDPLLRRVLLLMVPITITLGILNFNALIGTWFAQFVSDRAAAEIGYAFRLYQLPQGIFAVTIGTVLFPSLSRFAAQHDDVRFRDTVSLGVRQMVFVSLPFVAWFAVMPQAFVQMVYERGQFDAQATVEVAGALAMFSIGLVFANSNIMLNRAFQSMQKPWLPLYVSVGNLALNVLLCWLLYKPLGVQGITLSMATVSAVNFAALFFLLRRQVGRIDGRNMAGAAGGALLCAAALAAVSYGVWWALEDFATGGFGRLVAAIALAVLAGAAVYFGLAKLLRLEELAVVRQLVRRRSRRPTAPPPSA
jgi:putative peptidoglycan lipid II flippase